MEILILRDKPIPKYGNALLEIPGVLARQILCMQNGGWEKIVIVSFEEIFIKKDEIIATCAISKKRGNDIEFSMDVPLHPSLVLSDVSSRDGNILNELLYYFVTKYWNGAVFGSFPYLQLAQRKVSMEHICREYKETIKRPQTWIAEGFKDIEGIAKRFFDKGQDMLIIKSHSGSRGEEVFLADRNCLEKTLQKIKEIEKSGFVVQKFFHKKERGKISFPPNLRAHVGIYSWKPLRYQVYPNKMLAILRDVPYELLKEADFNIGAIFRRGNALSKTLEEYLFLEKEKQREVEACIIEEVGKILCAIIRDAEGKNVCMDNTMLYLGFDFLLLQEGENYSLQFTEIEDSPNLFPPLNTEANKENLIAHYKNVKKNIASYNRSEKFCLKKHPVKDSSLIRKIEEIFCKDAREINWDEIFLLFKKKKKRETVFIQRFFNFLSCQKIFGEIKRREKDGSFAWNKIFISSIEYEDLRKLDFYRFYYLFSEFPCLFVDIFLFGGKGIEFLFGRRGIETFYNFYKSDFSSILFMLRKRYFMFLENSESFFDKFDKNEFLRDLILYFLFANLSKEEKEDILKVLRECYEDVSRGYGEGLNYPGILEPVFMDKK